MNRDKWWKLAHIYRGRVCWCHLAKKLRSGQGGSARGAVLTRDGTYTTDPGKQVPVLRAVKPSVNTSGPGGPPTGPASTQPGGAVTAWPKKGDR